MSEVAANRGRTGDVGRLFPAVIAVVFWSASVTAAPPDVSAIYPAGGQRGTTVKLTLQGKVEPDKLKLWCDRSGVELVGAEGKDAVQLKIADDVEPGWCWLGFFSAEGASPQRPFYIGTLPELLEDEPNNRIGEKLLTLPTVANGVLQKSGDVDVFPCALKAGETVAASVVARQRLSSPMDAILQVVDARGFVLAQSDDSVTFDPSVAFTAKADGVYAVRVFGFPATPDSSIRFAGGSNFIYRLSLTTGPLVTRVSPPVIAANSAARVKAEGWNMPGDAEFDVKALPAGVHPVEVPFGVSTARVLACPHPIVVESPATADAKPQAIGVPGCATGRVASHGAGSWSFTAKKGEKVALGAVSRALGSPLDVVLRVTDAAGKTLQEVDDAVQGDVDATLEFTPPADGDYVVSVRDRFAHGGPEYQYALIASIPEPDFALSVPADAFTFIPGKDAELTVNVEARSGFDDEIQISVEGLPEGCTAEPVKITAKASVGSSRSGRSGRRGGGTPTSTAKLLIKTTKTDGWDGGFKVIGRTEGDQPLERFAVGKPANTDTPRPHLRAVITAKP